MARRQYLGALILLAVGGVLGLTAASRPWGSVQFPSALMVTSTTVSGSDLLPFAPAVSLVAIAAVVAVPAVRRIGRRVIGALLAVLGAILAATAELAVTDLDGRIESWAMNDPGAAGAVEKITTSPGWGLAVAAAGVVILVAGVLIAVRGPSWPAMGAKYERPAPGQPAAPGAPAAGELAGPGPEPAPGPSGTSDPSAREAWEALDRGEDPT